MTTIFAMLIVAGIMYWFAVLPAEKKAEDLKKELDVMKAHAKSPHVDTSSAADGISSL